MYCVDNQTLFCITHVWKIVRWCDVVKRLLLRCWVMAKVLSLNEVLAFGHLPTILTAAANSMTSGCLSQAAGQLHDLLHLLYKCASSDAVLSMMSDLSNVKSYVYQSCIGSQRVKRTVVLHVQHGIKLRQLSGSHGCMCLRCRLPLEQLQHAITPEVCQDLQQRGYAVVEGIFGGAWCSRLRGEIEALRQAGALHLNSTHLVRGSKRQLLEKANIWESELMQEASLTHSLHNI